MSIAISPNLNLVCKVITSLIEQEDVNTFGLYQILSNLTALERFFVSEKFCTLPWNYGSLRVLHVLQKLRILTASEYILQQKENEEAQMILNDFFEGEFELLSNLFINDHYDPQNLGKMTLMLDEMLHRLLMDLQSNTELGNLKYLDALLKLLPSTMLPKLMQRHLNIILALQSCTVNEAYRNYSHWINESIDDSSKFIEDMYEKLLHLNPQDVITHLFKVSSTMNFRSWKFYLILLRTIASHSDEQTGPYIRSYFKTRLRQIATVPQKTAFQHLLLSVRATTATTNDVHKNINAYADWYKNNIGEMKFVLNTDEFMNILQLLEQCIEDEVDMDFADVHATICISPPTLCGKMVHAHRRKCKEHLAQLKAKFRTATDDIPIIDILSSSEEF